MSARIRALIVDDEPLARRGVRARLRRHHDIEIVAEASGGKEAAQAIVDHRPDVVFLDIQMPDMDGFDVLAGVPREVAPEIIFLTAHDEHAVRAFDAAALDYLLKPIDDERFDTAIQRLRARLDSGRRDSPATRLVIRDRGNIVLLPPAEICWLEAHGDYVRVHTGKGSHVVRETLTRIEQRLPSSSFARIHRSAIVNVAQVRELRPLPNREFVVVLRDGGTLRLSRTYRDAIHALMREAPADVTASAGSARGRG